MMAPVLVHSHKNLKPYEKGTPSPMFSAKFVKFYRTLILQNTSGRAASDFQQHFGHIACFCFVCSKYFGGCFMDKSLLQISLFIYLYVFICFIFSPSYNSTKIY